MFTTPFARNAIRIGLQLLHILRQRVLLLAQLRHLVRTFRAVSGRQLLHAVLDLFLTLLQVLGLLRELLDGFRL